MTWERNAMWAKWWATQSPGDPFNVPKYQEIWNAAWDAATTAASSMQTQRGQLDSYRTQALYEAADAVYHALGDNQVYALRATAAIRALHGAPAEGEQSSTLVYKTQETFAANTRAGDAGNEAEREQRLKEAILGCNRLYGISPYMSGDFDAALRAIIAKAQG
jgi:hypothetical protein